MTARTVLALLLGVSGLPAQTNIPDALVCARCTIRMDRLAVLGTFDGPGSLPGSSIIKMDGGGRFWVIHPPDLPLVFDSTGRPLTTPFRKGVGPGEFRGPALPFALPGDSTLAIEAIPPRATVLGPDLRGKRVIQLRLMPQAAAVLRWPDLVMIKGQPPGRPRGPDSFSLSSFAGSIQEIAKSFGSRPGDPARPEGNSVNIARSGNTVWTADITRYRLTEWSVDGVLLRDFERKPDWFDGDRAGPINRQKPPTALVGDISVDERGLLWVFVHIAADTWREGWPMVPPGTRSIAADRIRQDKLYRTMVEIIDPAAARVVARYNFPEYIPGVFPNGRAAVYYVDADDIPHYRLVRLTLEGHQVHRGVR